jgi:hypothetical protein
VKQWRHFMEVVNHIKKRSQMGVLKVANPFEKVMTFIRRLGLSSLLRPTDKVSVLYILYRSTVVPWHLSNDTYPHDSLRFPRLRLLHLHRVHMGSWATGQWSTALWQRRATTSTPRRGRACGACPRK